MDSEEAVRRKCKKFPDLMHLCNESMCPITGGVHLQYRRNQCAGYAIRMVPAAQGVGPLLEEYQTKAERTM